MASLNFPNTGLVANVTQYTGDNGTTYIWDGVKWVGRAAGGAAGTNSLQNGSFTVQVDVDGDLVLPVGSIIKDSDGNPVGGAGGGVSISDFGPGFTDTLDAGKITTSKLYNENPNQGLNNQYALEVTNGGVVALPDGSIINGATLKTVPGNYAGITAGPNGADEDSWVWVDNNGATIATKYSTDNHVWEFDNSGILTLPQGSTIGETATTTVITPPGAAAGQSLVIRPTAGQFSLTTDHPDGFVPGETITITVGTLSGDQTGTLDYQFTGATSQQLGRALTGTLTFTSEAEKTITWTVPAQSSMTTFTFSLIDATGFDGQGGVYVPGLPNFTITLDGTSGEVSHVHLMAGNPVTTDIYLGDDDQYVKIEKNGGDVVVGTDTDTNHWRFGTGGNLTLPQGGDILNSNGISVLGGGVPTVANTKKGFINLVGDRPNDESDVWFESVLVRGVYAYVLGGDSYINNSNNSTKVYKFNVETGAQVWVKQITAGSGASFDFTVGTGVITLDAVPAGGSGYKVSEEIVIQGWQINGSEPTNSFVIIVNTIDVSGGILTASIKPGYDVAGLSDTFTNIASEYENARGEAVCLGYDDDADLLLVVTEMDSGLGDSQDSFWQWTNLYAMNPTTGAIVSTRTLSDEGDINANSIATFDAAGKIAIVGEKFNETRELGVLNMLTKGNGYFDILKSQLDAEHYPGAPANPVYNFWLTGTGITNREYLDDVNYYFGLPTTVRQGTGATFSVTIDNTNAISGLAVANAGTNYLPGHRITLLRTDFEMPDGTDIVVTVTTVGVSGNITGATATYSGPGSAVEGVYTAITGTYYNPASGLAITYRVDTVTGALQFEGIVNPGSNYVAGDVVTIDGTQFANGATPANDIVVNIVAVGGGSGDVNTVSTSSTAPTNALRIRVDNVDFTTIGGAWTLRENLGGEAFVWTPGWTNTIGGTQNDVFYDVTWNRDGTALYAVGEGRYETDYDQALVVKFNATTGAVTWSTDIKFSQAGTRNRSARAVCLVPNSDDIMVGGEWYNNTDNRSELILSRITSLGAPVWQKTYALESEGGEQYMDNEISLKAVGNNVVVSFEQSTNSNSQGLAYMVINPNTGTVIRHRVVSSDGNSNYNSYNTSTANWADVYSDATGDYVVMAGYTYVPTDNSNNALLMKLPLDGLVDIAIDERYSLGEHMMNRHTVNVTTVTSAFDSFTATEHLNTITTLTNARNYTVRAPDSELMVWTQTLTNDSEGYLEFGDGSKQSFATNTIPQILAANDYWLTEQDSGKHIFFEHENGRVYIPHSSVRYFPVGFTFTIVNTTGNDCYLRTQSVPGNNARLKLAGRNIDTYVIGIPDSGSGSMVTVMKIKDGYTMVNSDNDRDEPDVWIVSGPGDVYNDD